MLQPSRTPYSVCQPEGEPKCESVADCGKERHFPKQPRTESRIHREVGCQRLLMKPGRHVRLAARPESMVPPRRINDSQQSDCYEAREQHFEKAWQRPYRTSAIEWRMRRASIRSSSAPCRAVLNLKETITMPSSPVLRSRLDGLQPSLRHWVMTRRLRSHA